MTGHDEPQNEGRDHQHATLREWARKTYMREHMRTDALSSHELKLLDDRLARWTADRQFEGSLPPKAELRARLPELEKEFRSGRDAARPIFTTEEVADIDASRGAAALRDHIETHRDFAPAMSNVSVQYAVSAGLSELDARKQVSERFEKLFGRTVMEYAQDYHQQPAHGTAPAMRDRLFPSELGWDRYEPTFRRLAMHDAKMHVDRRDGEISEKEFQETRKTRDGWVREQQQMGKLPGAAEMGAAPVSVHDTLLPFQKNFGRQERQKMHGHDSAYWRRVDEMAGYVKSDIASERRFTRNLDDYALAHAGDYDRRVERMKGDIQDRFMLKFLYSPSEFLEKEVERQRDHNEFRVPKEEQDFTIAPGRDKDRGDGGGRSR